MLHEYMFFYVCCFRAQRELGGRLAQTRKRQLNAYTENAIAAPAEGLVILIVGSSPTILPRPLPHAPSQTPLQLKVDMSEVMIQKWNTVSSLAATTHVHGSYQTTYIIGIRQLPFSQRPQIRPAADFHTLSDTWG